MPTVHPKGERFRRAIRWISERLKEDPSQSQKSLINEAITKFDLNPVESENLSKFYRNR
jgi:uncharacterized protein involved in exopolysaccharide biosynthesis